MAIGRLNHDRPGLEPTVRIDTVIVPQVQNTLIAQWLMHRALTKINSVTVDTETDPGLGCATSARLPNMWPVAGNPVVRAPQGNYGNREVKPCPGQDSNPRSTLTFVRARCINHFAIKAFCTCGTITGSSYCSESAKCFNSTMVNAPRSHKCQF